MSLVAQLVYGVLTILLLAIAALAVNSLSLLVLSGMIAGLTYVYHIVAAYDPDQGRAMRILVILHLAIMALTAGGYAWLLWKVVWNVYQSS